MAQDDISIHYKVHDPGSYSGGVSVGWPVQRVVSEYFDFMQYRDGVDTSYMLQDAFRYIVNRRMIHYHEVDRKIYICAAGRLEECNGLFDLLSKKRLPVVGYGRNIEYYVHLPQSSYPHSFFCSPADAIEREAWCVENFDIDPDRFFWHRFSPEARQLAMSSDADAAQYRLRWQ